MELRHLRYFQTVAETLSFSQAALKLRVAQSAISRQISALEKELGFALFIRNTSRVRLTDAGRHLKQELARVLTQLDLAVTGAQVIAKGQGGELNIGSDWRFQLPQLPQAVMAFRREHPRINVNFVEIPIHEHVAALKEGRIHLTFMTSVGIHYNGISDLKTVPVLSTNFIAVVAKSHRLANEGRIAIRELRNETWIRLNETTFPGFKSVITQICHTALFTPKFSRTSTNSFEGMFGRISMGEGVGIAKDWMLPHTRDNLAFLDTDLPPDEFHAIWSDNVPNETRESFVRILKQTIADSDATPESFSHQPVSNL